MNLTTKQKQVVHDIKNGVYNKVEAEYLTSKLKQVKRQINTYSDYVKHVFEIILGEKFVYGKHIDFICNKIDLFLSNKMIVDGDVIDVLCFSLPPQHGKSMCLTETLPSYYLGKYPTNRVILTGYSDAFAQKFSRRNKEKIQRFGNSIYGINISKKKESTKEFELDNELGSCIARGIQSGITGNPADLIIVDDPIKTREEAESETIREKIWDEYLNSLKTRLSAKGKIIVIQTRWHEDDLIGRIEKYETNYEYYNIPCEAQEHDLIDRPKGDSLFPGIGKDNTWKDKIKKSYLNDPDKGYRAWLSLFQGQPNTIEGNKIKRWWFNYWQYEGKLIKPQFFQKNETSYVKKYAEFIPDYFDDTVQSWDCSFKKTEKSDMVCGTVWGRRLQKYYLLDMVNKKMDIIETMEGIKAFKEKYPRISSTFIEDKANGSAVIQMLGSKLPGIIPIEPDGGKEARVNAVSPALESGNVYIPHPSYFNWVNEFLDQCCKFPEATYDDIVDSTSQALNRLIYKSIDTYNPNKIQEGTHWHMKELLAKGYKRHEILKMERDGHIILIKTNR